VSARKKVTSVAIRGRKRPNGERIVTLTAYDYPTALALDAAGVDVLLVGDSLGMVVLGYDSTLPVTMEDMLHHVKAVTRAKPKALVVGDLPFLSYHVSVEQAVVNAGRLVQEGGADTVKLEGGAERAAAIAAITAAKIPVMGHLGLTPQSVLEFGGYRVQGRGDGAADRLVADARAIEAAGCFAMVLEGIPAPVAKRITEAVAIPTIGIGAGPDTDGQVLVIHDLVTFGGGARVPRFVRRYADVSRLMTDAAAAFAEDVRSGRYPSDAETYPE